MNDIKKSMNIDSCASLFRKRIKTIFCFHLLFIENTINIMKKGAIFFKNFSKSFSLYLICELIECVTVNEKLFFGGMCVEIKVKCYTLIPFLHLKKVSFKKPNWCPEYQHSYCLA